MRRCGYVIYSNLAKRRLLRCGSIPLWAETSARHQSSRGSQNRTTNLTFTTNSNSITAAAAAATEKNEAAASSSPPIIQGTIPLHGKGLKMGQYAQVHRTFTQDDVNLFGRLSGDMNPVHFPPTTTPTLQTIYDKESSSSSSTAITNDSSKLLPIVHGILLSSLFSNIFGNLIPGAIYRHQSLKFHNAVHVNESVVGRVVVTKLRQINRKGRGGGVLCTCDTCVIKMDVAAAQLFDDETRSNDSNKHDGGSSNRETKEIVCISGDAQVWLPDLQLVYECREKGE
jgi:acyl dehydratase